VAIATYKDLCIDAADPASLGEFWAPTLGLRLVRLDDGDVRLDGATPQHSIWVNRVPEPVTVKQRVHLDVNAHATDEVLGRGATAVDLDAFRWKVLKDPEGGELCVFEREEVADYKLYEVVVDARDGHAIASWWADVLGASVQDHEGEDDVFSWFEDAPGMPFEMVFGDVPEPKTVKNRIHWDVDTDDVRLLVDAGASVLRAPDERIGWTVMADPERNEFCAFTPRD
jgi:hypothetical protein